MVDVQVSIIIDGVRQDIAIQAEAEVLAQKETVAMFTAFLQKALVKHARSIPTKVTLGPDWQLVVEKDKEVLKEHGFKVSLKNADS